MAQFVSKVDGAIAVEADLFESARAMGKSPLIVDGKVRSLSVSVLSDMDSGIVDRDHSLGKAFDGIGYRTSS
jgi:hypothetical protein